MRRLTILASIAFKTGELDRFWSRVDTSGGADACWTWRGALYSTGYGRFWVCRSGAVTPILAHRLAFYLANHVDPGLSFVCHACDNKPCCNPAHLQLGSNSDNIRDAITRGLKSPSGGVLPGERNGFAKLNAETVLTIRRTYAEGGTTARRLAAQYGIAKSHVLRILHGEVWRHLQDGRVEVR